MIVVGIASIPGREKNLIKTIQSLYDYVDEIGLCLHNYEYEQSERIMSIGNKVGIYGGDNSIGDSGKFLEYTYQNNHIKDFYYLGCDDDLIYDGERYVQMMIEGVKKYKCPVSLHGKTYDYPTLNWRRAVSNYRCLDKVENDVEVDVVGTGCLAMHSDMMDISMSMFEKPNMADLFFSYEAKKAGLPLMVLAHPEGTVKYSLSDREPTIWKERVDEKFKTELVNKILKLPVK